MGRAAVTVVLLTGVGLAVNCGGDTSDATGGGGEGGQLATTTASSSSSSSCGTGGTGGTPCAATDGVVFALTSLDFGDGDNGEWKKLGFNIDGLTSTATSTDVCQPNSGGDPNTAYPDGDNGIDNSFGANLVPEIIALYPTWTTDANNNIKNGVFNALMKLYCLPDQGDAPSIVTKVFGTTPLATMPAAFDGTDQFPVQPELLADPTDPESSTIIFPTSSVIDNVFDSGKNQTFVLTIPMASTSRSTSLKLTIHHAQVTMTLSADHKTATKGIIGGVLDTEEFIAEVEKVGYVFGLCGTVAFDAVLQEIRQASDILSDGTQDPTKTCDGISVGLGFEMAQDQIGSVGPPATVGLACTD
jgi:hypothetical protein